MKRQKNIVIIGAGPAGLSCGLEIVTAGQTTHQILVVEKDSQIGGLSKTFQLNGSFFDIGPHRFFTKDQVVSNLWKKELGKDFLEVRRLTRILYNNRLFHYPIQLKDVIKKLGFKISLVALVSFASAQVFDKNLIPQTFEEWVSKNFGKKLYQIFFKTYTEKVWGIPCHKIGAEWADQRIKNLNITEVIKTAILGQRVRRAKSLVDKFYYPRYGAGSMYQAMAKHIMQHKGVIKTERTVKEVRHRQGKIIGINVENNGKTDYLAVDHLVSSMALPRFIKILRPEPPSRVIHAAKKLYFRAHISVNLLIESKQLFPDNWVYIHSPEVKMARVANYANFSSAAAKKGFSPISVEYFSFLGGRIWKMKDRDLFILAKRELRQSGLVDEQKIKPVFIIREPEAYPTYFIGFEKYLNIIKKYVKSFQNLQMIGRGGLYRYNNMDHSILTGILAAKNLILGNNKYDPWELVNVEKKYHEEKDEV